MLRTRPCRYQCSLPVKFLKSASVNFFLLVMVSAFLFGFGCILLMQPTRPAPMSGEASARVRKLLQQLFWGAPALAGGAKTPWGLSLARARAAALSATGGSRAKGSAPAGGKWQS